MKLKFHLYETKVSSACYCSFFYMKLHMHLCEVRKSSFQGQGIISSRKHGVFIM